MATLRAGRPHAAGRSAGTGASQIIAGRGAGSRYLVADTMQQARRRRLRGPGRGASAAAHHPGRSGRHAVVPAGGLSRRGCAAPAGAASALVPHRWRRARSSCRRGRARFRCSQPPTTSGITAFEVRAQPADARQHEAYRRGDQRFGRRQASAAANRGHRRAGRPAPDSRLAGGASASVVVDVSAFGEGPLRASVRADGDALRVGRRRLRVPAGQGQGASRARHQRQRRPRAHAAPAAAPDRGGGRARAHCTMQGASMRWCFDRYRAERAAHGARAAHRSAQCALASARSRRSHATRGMARWDGSHPLLSGVSLRDVLVDRATLLKPGTGERAASLATVRRGQAAEPLILATREGRRLALVGFALEESNFPQQASFPAFLSNAIDWLTREPRALAARVGQVQCAGGARARARSGRAGSDHARRSRARRCSTRPSRVCTPRSRGDERMRVAVNLFDPHVTEVNASRFAQGAAPVAAVAGAAPAGHGSLDPAAGARRRCCWLRSGGRINRR